MRSVAIAITTFRRPERLRTLLTNMRWSGIPDIPVYVFEDPVPTDNRDLVTKQFREVCDDFHLPLQTAPEWGCMQGIIQYAFEKTEEDWIIYVPDDVLFTKGALWNEYSGVLTYGRDFVGGIQAPYWNAHDLVQMGLLRVKEEMYLETWIPENVAQNPHWNGFGVPRKYINLNGAGFSLSRSLFRKMGGWPRCTWRLDEYAGYMAWQLGYVILTLPGPTRIHYFGATTSDQPPHDDFSSVENWKKATGGTPEETGYWTRLLMDQVPEEFDRILRFFQSGGTIMRGQ